MNDRDTIVPLSYPELENEIYVSLDAPTERQTLVPEPIEQWSMQADCVLSEE